MTLREILARRDAIRVELRGIIDASPDGNLSDEVRARADALEAEAGRLNERERRQVLVDELDRRAAGTPIGGTGDRNLERDLRQFSVVRAIASQVPGLNVDAGRERELSQEIARRAGRPFQGIAVPMSVFQERVEQRVLTSGSGGTALIPTTLDDGLFIDRLRAALVVRRLGARVISGLTGNLDIPRLTTSATSGWVAENAALTASDSAFDKVSLAPKHAGCISELSRNMLMQDSADVEQLVRNDFAQVLAQTLDLAAIAGTGTSNQPTGILNTSGIGSVAMGANGAALTYDAVVDLMGAIQDANAEAGAVAFLTNPKVRRAAVKLKDSQARPLGEAVVFQNMPRAFTTNVPSNGTKGSGTGLSALLYANWSDLLIGMWSELDILVNPFESTAYSKGNVQVRAMMTVDIKVRHPASFAAITDIVA
jgi:HK97 family phage major capsid protein